MLQIQLKMQEKTGITVTDSQDLFNVSVTYKIII